MTTRLAIAISAGLVSALLFLAAATGAVASLMALVFLTPLPISIVGFGWGWVLAAAASGTAALFLAVVGSFKAGLLHLLLFGAPSTVAIYYLLLNRQTTTPAGRETVEWYPIGRVLFGLAITGGVMATAALLSLGSSTADLQTHVTKVADRMMSVDLPWPGGEKPSADQIGDMIKYLTASFAAAITMTWLWITLFNLWIGAKVARASGILSRPWPNVSLITLPRVAGLALAAAVALSFMDDYPGLIASGFATGIFLAHLLVGLAIVHNVTWKNPVRPLLLIALYAFFFFFNPLSSLAIASIALIEPFLPMRNPYNGGLITKDPPDQT